jgi:hypothetical protein
MATMTTRLHLILDGGNNTLLTPVERGGEVGDVTNHLFKTTVLESCLTQLLEASNWSNGLEDATLHANRPVITRIAGLT